MTAEETGSAGASAASGEGVTESLSQGTGSQPDTRPRCDSTSADIASRKALDAIVARHYDEQHSHSVTAKPWFHEFGFSGGEDFEHVVEYATRNGFNFVYGGATKEAAWVGYPAEYEKLEALVVSERERADKAEQERDEALQAARDGGWEMSSEEEVRHLAEMCDSHAQMAVELAALVVSERERADALQAKLEKAEEFHVARMAPLLEYIGDVEARAVRAETALRAIADGNWNRSTGLNLDAFQFARAALSGLAGDTEERQPCS